MRGGEGRGPRLVARGPRPGARRGAGPAPSAHLLVWDAGCSWLLWKGYLNSSLLPLLPELTRITLMGLVLSPMLPWGPEDRGGGCGRGEAQEDSPRAGAAGRARGVRRL